MAIITIDRQVEPGAAAASYTLSYHVVNVLPVVERDQLEGGQHRPRERVKVGVTKVGVAAQAGQAHVVGRAVPSKNTSK